MAKRNYKAEYQRRIANGLAAGLSRGQAAGHPNVKKGEVRASSENFFKQLREQFNDMIGNVAKIFEGVDLEGNCEVGYINRHGRILERWFVGGGGCIPDRMDFQKLWETANRERAQQSYAMTISGTTEEPYPGKGDQLEITLSYRIDRSAFQDALNDRSNRTLSDVINALLPQEREEKWMIIDQITIINKD